MTRHLDELTLLLYTVKDLDPEQVAATAAHLSNCQECATASPGSGKSTWVSAGSRPSGR